MYKRNKFILISLSLFLSLNLFAGGDISEEAKRAAKEAAYVAKKANEAKQTKIRVTPKTEAQIETAKEKKDKKKDKGLSLDLNIKALKNLLYSIKKSYVIADVDFSMIGTTKFYIYEQEKKKAIKGLITQKELRNEINALLRVLRTSKNVNSNWALNEMYNKVNQKYIAWSKKATVENKAYQSASGKRVWIKKGLIANGIYAKRQGDGVKLYYK